MDYKKTYFEIITHHGAKVKSPGDERHHIIPTSLGGNHTPDNWIYVTPRIHFILHQLLFRMTDGEDKRKMYYAVLLMGHSRKIKTGAHYQLLREQQGNKQTERMMGNTPWNKGRKWDEETKQKFRNTRKGKFYGMVWRIEYKGEVYDSIKECCQITGDSYYLVTSHGTKLEKYRPT